MTVPIRFIKPADLRSTIRGLAIMSVMFGKKQDSHYWTEPSIACDLGIWRNSGGSACYFLFAPKGAILMGSDPESPMNPKAHAAGSAEYKPWPGVFEEVTKDLNELVRQNPFGEDFKMEEVTFAIWNTAKGLDWKKGKIDYPKRDTGDPDGSKALLGQIREYYDHFEDEMEEEYEKKIDPDSLFVIFSGDPLTVEDLKKVKTDLNVASVREGLKVIGVIV